MGLAPDPNDPEGLHQRLHHHLAHGLFAEAGGEAKACLGAGQLLPLEPQDFGRLHSDFGRLSRAFSSLRCR